MGDDTSVNMYEFSYTYPLSKRTLLYAGYVMIDNQKNGGYNFHVNQIAGVCTGTTAANGGLPAAARPTVRRASPSAWSSSGRIPGNTFSN